jgi:hypothetical protein
MYGVDATLQPCPFCGSRDLEVQPDGRIHCRGCDTWGPAAGKEEAGWGRRQAGGRENGEPGGGRLSLALAAFALGLLTFLYAHAEELTDRDLAPFTRAAAVLLLLSLLLGVARLALEQLAVVLPRRWQDLLLLAQAALAALAALPMVLALLLA